MAFITKNAFTKKLLKITNFLNWKWSNRDKIVFVYSSSIKQLKKNIYFENLTKSYFIAEVLFSFTDLHQSIFFFKVIQSRSNLLLYL